MPWVYPNQWVHRFPWDSMDAKNHLQKPNSPPPKVGHWNFLSHPINMSMMIFMIWSKYWAQATRLLANMTIRSNELVGLWHPYGEVGHWKSPQDNW